MTLVAGVDCSTQSTKVAVVDADSGELVGFGQAGHTVTGTGGARETDPANWWEALRSALAQTRLAADVSAISVAGQQHGLVCLDAAGAPIRPAMLWNDTRSALDAARLLEALGGATAWASRIGVVPVASFTATKWAWLRRRERQTVARTAAIRLPHDYLTEKLAGAGVTDRGDASGTAWWSTESEAYAGSVLQLPELALPAELLPRVLWPDEPAGTVTPAAAAATGLTAGIVVGPGTGDNMAAALGLGLEPGAPVLSLGTSGTVYLVSTTRTVDPTGCIAGFADATGRFLPLAATLNCTLAVDRMASWLGLSRDDVMPSDGVVALPYFDGERTPNLPEATAAILGLRHETNPRSILMATYEGAVMSLLDALQTIDSASSGVDPNAPLTLIGGGAKGVTWQQVARRLSGRTIRVPSAGDLVAIGAAAQAAAVLRGVRPETVSAGWRSDSGVLLEAMPRDDEVISRHRAVHQAAVEAVQIHPASR